MNATDKRNKATEVFSCISSANIQFFESKSQYPLIINELDCIKKRFRTTLCKMIFIFAFRRWFIVYAF